MTARFPLATLFAGALSIATAAAAADVSMDGGSIAFRVPDDWQPIMQTMGDPEVQVFRVPDPSPTGSNALARISVTVKKVGDIDAFEKFVGAAAGKAARLADYRASSSSRNSRGMDSANYTARENGVPFAYSEGYWFEHGKAIQLRCVRPLQSQAGTGWQTRFDQGCQNVAAQIAAKMPH